MVFNVYYLEKGATKSSPCIILERDFLGEMMIHLMSYLFKSLNPIIFHLKALWYMSYIRLLQINKQKYQANLCQI